MTAPQRSYHRDDLESELLAWAGRIITERGVEGLSLRELGRAAGVSRAAPYHYFPTKAALLQRVGALGFTRLAESIVVELSGRSDPLARALAGFRGYLTFALREPAIFKLMFDNRLARNTSSDGVAYPFSSDEARSAFGLLTNGISGLRPLLRDDEHARLVVTNMIWAYAHGVSMLAIGDNLKGVEAAALLEEGLRVLLTAPR